MSGEYEIPGPLDRPATERQIIYVDTLLRQEVIPQLRAMPRKSDYGPGDDFDYDDNYWDNPDQGVHQYDGGLGDGSFL